METVEDGAPEFGKAKLLTRELPESMTADEFQVILGKEMTLAGCAKSRKTPVFVKKNASGLSSKPAEKELRRVKAAGTRAGDVGPATAALRPGQFPGNQLEAQGKGLWCNCCGTEVIGGSWPCELHTQAQLPFLLEPMRNPVPASSC